MELSREIEDAYFDAKGRNGSPRLAKDLQALGINVSRTTVARHMQKMGLRGKLSKKFRVTTDASHNYNVAPNLLNREFNQEEPAKACVSDVTYISCKDGLLYLTCVIDLFDRKLICWSISDNLTASGTVIPAIRMANRNRPFKKGMIFHSDRGIQGCPVPNPPQDYFFAFPNLFFCRRSLACQHDYVHLGFKTKLSTLYYGF